MITPPVAFVYRESKRRRRLTRAFDVAIASAAAIVALPIVSIAALAVMIEDGGPPFFHQKRVGRFGKLFELYKLRTMKLQSCSDATSPTTSSDDRITRVGAFLRATSIDELPQLLNVLRGDMAIVGPRPEMPFLVRKYERWQQLRHFARPGITGLWQIECRSRIPLAHPEATKIDLRYVMRASLGTDGAILARTVVAILSRQGAY